MKKNRNLVYLLLAALLLTLFSSTILLMKSLSLHSHAFPRYFQFLGTLVLPHCTLHLSFVSITFLIGGVLIDFTVFLAISV